MDNVDGKQARRTGTSSPLGELFEYVINTAQRANITILIAT
jgi:phosphatidylglycerophosphate synthase